MTLGPIESLSDDEIEPGLRYVVKDGIASQSIGILTGGAFLVAFAGTEMTLELPASMTDYGQCGSPYADLLQTKEAAWKAKRHFLKVVT